MVKLTRAISLTLLASLLLLAAAVLTVEAQSQATVTVLDSLGGSTTPAAGTYQYNDGSSVTFTATPTDPTSMFSYWILSTDAGSRIAYDNPLTFPVTAGTNYSIQPVFQLIEPVPGVTSLPANISGAAIIVVLQAAGGTTTPAPGAYALANATATTLTATPASGWQFSHWVITGAITSHGSAPLNLEPTDNPYNVNHGYGATYYYQPVFTQTNATPTPSPTVPELPLLAVLLLIGAMIPVVFIARRRRVTRAGIF